MVRDDFSKATKDILAKRAAFLCSNPSCKRPTQGPDQSTGVMSIGVAAHICAASPNGPRYDPNQSSEERSDSSNGVWLCQTCSRLVDVDIDGHPPELLREWKAIRELSAALEIRGFEIVRSRGFRNLEQKCVKLIAEMRDDLGKQPLVRDLVCLSRKYRFIPGEYPAFPYYVEDHDSLHSQLQVMENYGAISDRTVTSVPRFRFSEDFVDYLLPAAERRV